MPVPRGAPITPVFPHPMNKPPIFFAAALLTVAHPALAQNAVIFGDVYTNGGHSDGGMYVGGNWYGSSFEANQHQADEIGIYLGGSNFTSNFLRAQGTSFIGGAKGNFSGTLGPVTAPDFNYYLALSEGYSALGNSISANLSAMNNVVLTLNNDLTVFNISTSDLTGHKTLDFIGTGNVVFNVTGNLNSWGWSVNYDPNKITWNFIDAATINISDRDFTGSLIAPNAHINQSKSINGLLVGESWTVNGSPELHGYSPVPLPGFPPVTPIPEPSILFLGAVSLIPLLRRRK